MGTFAPGNRANRSGFLIERVEAHGHANNAALNDGPA